MRREGEIGAFFAGTSQTCRPVCQGGGSRVAAGPAVLSPAQAASLLPVNLSPIAQSMSYS